MAQKPQATGSGQRVLGNPLVPCLYAVAIFVGAVCVIAAMFQLGLVLSRQTQPVQADEVARIVMTAVGGAAAALLLMGVATVINYMQGQMQLLARLVRSQEDTVTALSRLNLPSETAWSAPAAESAAQTTWIDSQRLEQIAELLHEINENVLLSPRQRQAKQSQHLDRMHRQMGEMLTRLLAEGKFPEAQRRVDEYARSFPQERQTAEGFQACLDQARAKAEEGDYQQAAGRMRDFMALGAWQRAEEVIQELLVRHPQSRKVKDLVDGLHAERSRFEQQQRQHLLAQIQQLSGKKEYREAYRQACDLINRFPESQEAQLLKGQMATLKDNAEIAIRRDLEEQLKELMRTHRYIEALALAQDIIARYPNSPQARVLKEQMPQMMSKAKMQMEQVG